MIKKKKPTITRLCDRCHKPFTLRNPLPLCLACRKDLGLLGKRVSNEAAQEIARKAISGERKRSAAAPTGWVRIVSGGLPELGKKKGQR